MPARHGLVTMLSAERVLFWRECWLERVGDRA
jgi:hypothetical protein